MHEKHSFIGAGLTAWFSKLTLTTQDWLAVAGLVLSGGFTMWTFFSNRAENKKRTQILETLSQKLVDNNAPPSTIAAVAKIMKSDAPVRETEHDQV